ncbi:MAG: DUF1573 domain-containing protein [Planctomycetaceae bacterium]
MRSVSRRNSVLVVAVCLVAGTALLAVMSRPHRQTMNWLQFEVQSHDFGSVIPGEVLRHDFPFKNVGPEILRISDISTSCGCTAADLPQRVYEPGESGKITVTFRLPPHPDPVAHSVTLISNDPLSPEKRLIVTADPEWPVAATPEAIHFPPTPEGSVLERRLEVFTPSGRSFDVMDIKATSKNIQVHERERVDRRRLYDIEVKLDRPGIFQEWIEIHTDAAGRELIRIPIDGTVGASERLIPSRIILGQRSPAEVVSRRLVITDSSLGDVRAVTMSNAEAWPMIEWSSAPPNVVNLRLQVPQSVGYQSGSVDMEFTNGSSMSIPISCIIQRSAADVQKNESDSGGTQINADLP